MKLEEVETILGQPYEINSMTGTHQLSCSNPKPRLILSLKDQTDIRKIVDSVYNDTNYCCDGNRDDKQTKEVTLTYTKPALNGLDYPMLWIHLDSNYRVFGVYAKKYERLLDDPVIYSLYYEPTIDSITGDLKLTDKITPYIDQKRFEECFN